MNYCDYQCDQGRNCPVRAAKEMAAAKSEEPMPLGTWESLGVYALLIMFALVSLAVVIGHMSGSFA